MDDHLVGLAQRLPLSPTLTVAALLLLTIVYLRFSLRSEAGLTLEVPDPDQCKPDWKSEVLENPSIKVSGSKVIQCYCPATGQSLGLINPSTSEGINRAVAKAKTAQAKWKTTTFAERRRVLRTILQTILKNQNVIAKITCLDSGKTQVDALFGEIIVTAERLQWTIKHGERALRPENRPTNLMMFYKSNQIQYEPLGVVAACVSWNYPIHNLLAPIISAIFAGNAIVVKCSEQVAWSSKHCMSIVQSAISACGHDPNIAQSIVCWPEDAHHLTSHPDIAHLTFIGSRPVAHAVAASAAKSLTPLVVELGGKDAAILLDDVGSDLDRIVQILMRGVFISAGQNCIGIERIIALPATYLRLIAKLEPLIRALRIGSVTAQPQEPSRNTNIDVGACISPANFSTLEHLISDAVSRGARLLIGGTRYAHPYHPSGHYFSPTLLVDVTPDMPIAQTEVFAPICLLMRASDPSTAIATANSTLYALGLSVFGRDTATLNRVAAECHAGMVAINDFGAYYMVQLPFGGTKGSGYGRFAGVEGIRGLCNAKSVCRDRWPRLIKTSIPAELWYPVRDMERAFTVGKAIVLMVYGGAGAKWEGLRKLVGR